MEEGVEGQFSSGPESQSARRPVREIVPRVRAVQVVLALTQAPVRSPRERTIAQDLTRPGTPRLQRG